MIVVMCYVVVVVVVVSEVCLVWHYSKEFVCCKRREVSCVGSTGWEA